MSHWPVGIVRPSGHRSMGELLTIVRTSFKDQV
jgi:hypothetical protein